MLDYFYLDLLSACGAIMISYLYYTRQRKTHPPLPPGPKPLPFLGNLLDLPKGKSWETYRSWGERFGAVVHLSVFGKSMVILNTFKAVNDLLERRSSVYSSRPYFPMSSDLMDLGRTTTAFQPYCDFWKKHRRLYHKYMNRVAIQEYQSSQAVASKRLLRALLESPQDYTDHIRRMLASVVMDIAYGHEVSSQSDPYVDRAERNSLMLSQVVRPGSYLVDTFPLLKYVPEWVPGAKFQKIAREVRESMHRERDIAFQDVKAQMASGTSRPSFVANALSKLNDENESSEDIQAIKIVAAGIFSGGTSTTMTIIHVFLLAMILHPEAQRKAQAELDSIVGKGRFPEFSDRPHLPYIDAVLKEVYRWLPIQPTAVPHVTTKDDVYEGYYIPANSMVFPNTWNILHDPEMYPEPSVFRPERFLPDGDKALPRNPFTGGAFGYGRRICPGRHIGDAAAWIAIASILSVLNISNALDENGYPIDVTYAYDPIPTGAVVQLRPFQCSITSRSKEAEALIKQMD